MIQPGYRSGFSICMYTYIKFREETSLKNVVTDWEIQTVLINCLMLCSSGKCNDTLYITMHQTSAQD